ncbi:low temperature requirement protein A [Streptococcus macacae]|uniref:Low temperature requirement protein LtrA n=1 Tax=Streptococcus macacae NCTC 11558 TaxID=764298 RepID=G5JU02_9STRE|nr:low temperature requirement protein A [Streptococcus macacae]EHJ52780.1 low temperature requirement protein LtrA [Streptococcus macacae NCTC 11558]SUN78370.1 putative low temperature requirement protein A [Streptococcus macacae NCTC 11558]
MKAKKVELTELFYDLVFVYAISKMTGLIHHLHHGVVAPMSIFTFVACLVVVVNVWIFQSVFINRYGRNSFWDISALFMSMACILFMSNSFSTENWETVFHPYALMTGLTTVILTAQYLVQHFRSDSEGERRYTLHYAIILAIRSAIVLLSAVLPYSIGIILFFAGVFIGVLLPFLIRSEASTIPVNFPHLVERFSLLVIITFGEMLIGVAPYFTVDTLNWSSLLVLLTVGFLFLFYIVEIDHLIDHHRKQESGYHLIYWHYPIFIGLSFITVSLGFFREEVHPLFLVIFLYTGFFLFYLGTYALRVYNKAEVAYPRNFVISQIAIFLISLISSLIFRDNPAVILTITTVAVTFISVRYVRFTILRIYQ